MIAARPDEKPLADVLVLNADAVEQFEHLRIEDGFRQPSSRMVGLRVLRAAVIDPTKNLSPDLKCFVICSPVMKWPQ